MLSNGMTVRNESGRMQNEEVLAKFKVQSWYLPQGTVEYHEKPLRTVNVLPGILNKNVQVESQNTEMREYLR